MKKPIKPFTQFGRWTVLYRIPGLTKNRAVQYMCKCSCGTIKPVLGYKLRLKESTSCGCFAKEQSSKRMITHGLTKHPLFSIYLSMHSRCYNQNNHAYPRYGGRGIYVCRRWHSVIKFIQDNELKTKKGLTIDRRDNNGPYSPNNTRWVDRQTQAMNRTNNDIVTYKNKSQPLFQWAYDLGLPPKTLWARIHRYNWSVEKALNTPVKR